MIEEARVDAALKQLLKYYSLPALDFFEEIEAYNRRNPLAGVVLPATAPEMSIEIIEAYCAAKYGVADSFNLERMHTVIKLRYLINNSTNDFQDLSIWILEPLENIRKNTTFPHAVADAQSANEFVAWWLSNEGKAQFPDNKQLEKYLADITLRLANNKGNLFVKKALAFVETGKKDVASLSLPQILSSVTEALTTGPAKRADAKKIADERARPTGIDLNDAVLIKCGAYEGLLRKYLPLLKVEEPLLFQRFNLILRKLVLKSCYNDNGYEKQLTDVEQDALNKRLHLALAKLAVVLSQDRDRRFLDAAEELHAQLDSHHQFPVEKVATGLLLQKTNDLVSQQEKETKSLGFLRKVLGWVRDNTPGKLLGLDFSTTALPATVPQGDIDALKIASLNLAGQLENNPDTFEPRRRFLNRMRKLQIALRDYAIEQQAITEINDPNDDVVKGLDTIKTLTFVHKNVSKLNQNLDATSAKPFFDQDVIDAQRTDEIDILIRKLEKSKRKMEAQLQALRAAATPGIPGTAPDPEKVAELTFAMTEIGNAVGSLSASAASPTSQEILNARRLIEDLKQDIPTLTI